MGSGAGSKSGGDVFSVSVLIMLSVFALLLGGIITMIVRQARKERPTAVR